MSTELELHVWPGAFELSSIDPSCLAAVLYLQLAIPNRFSIVECTSPDSSPNGRRVFYISAARSTNAPTIGQLPYVSHDLSNISSLGSIVKYVSGLPGASDLDATLSVLEKAQTTAWVSHATSHLGDLVVCNVLTVFPEPNLLQHRRTLSTRLGQIIPK